MIDLTWIDISVKMLGFLDWRESEVEELCRYPPVLWYSFQFLENSVLYLLQSPCQFSLQYIAFCLELWVSDWVGGWIEHLSVDGKWHDWFVFLIVAAATGISFVQFINHNSMRNMYILGLSLFLGISIPQYFNDFNDFKLFAAHWPLNTNAGWFNDIVNTVFSSAPTVAILVGTLLDTTLETVNTAVDRGLPWWIPFQQSKGDVRNDEFYSYPVRLGELIPTKYL